MASDIPVRARARETSIFNAGRVPMLISGSWLSKHLATEIDVAVAQLPTMDEAASAPMRPWLQIEATFVAKGARRPEEAFQFAAYLSGPEAGRALAQDSGLLPATAAAFADPALAGDPSAQGFRAQLETAAPVPNWPAMALAWSAAGKALKRMVQGEATPALAWGQAQRELVLALAMARARA